MNKDLEKFNSVNYNLHLLQEECLETAMVASKALRFGLTDCDPDAPNSLPKYKLLEQELGDILAIVDILLNNGIGISWESIMAAKEKKFEKLAKYYGTGDFADNKPTPE